MIENLINQIDKSRIIEVLEALQLTIPSYIEDTSIFTEIEKPRVSVIQLNYVNDEYIIGKFYITLNSNIEVALNGSYEFHVLNYYLDDEENTIHSCDVDGVEVANYYINRDALSGYNNSTYMRKSSGDIYVPSFRQLTDEYEPIRREWELTDKLLCYSKKVDGRMCFYITVAEELNHTLINNIFRNITK